jgi:hypothetical protein
MSDNKEPDTTDTSNDYKKLEPTFLTGLVHGIAGIFGFGEYADVSGELSKASSDAQQNLQFTMSSLTAQALINQTELDKELLQYIKANNTVIYETMNVYNSISKNNFLENNIFTKILSMLMFIFLIFMLAK